MSDETRYQPDISRIPASLRGLDWRPVDPTCEWRNGMTLLVAVQLLVGQIGAHAKCNPQRDWLYALSIITVEGDRRRVFRCNGFEFDWRIWDCDWYVVISE